MTIVARSVGPIHLGLDVHRDSITAGMLPVNASTWGVSIAVPETGAVLSRGLYRMDSVTF